MTNADRLLELFRDNTSDSLGELLDGLAQAIRRARRNKSSFAFMFMALNDFKSINDRFRHGAGNAVLRIVGLRLTESVRNEDNIARIHGDEFDVLLA